MTPYQGLQSQVRAGRTLEVGDLRLAPKISALTCDNPLSSSLDVTERHRG